MKAPARPCHLCDDDGGFVVWHDDAWRVVRVVDDPSHPVFYRVVSRRHVAEFSDLAPDERVQCMALVAAVERVLRERAKPLKVNLASLGNLVPHLHWHVVARYADDRQFPHPIWAPPQRESDPAALAARRAALPALDDTLRATLSVLGHAAH